VIFVASESGLLAALNSKTGEEKWTFKPKGKTSFKASPSLAEGYIYIGAMDGTFYAIEIPTGKVAWQTKLDAPIQAAAHILDGSIYVLTSSGTLYALH
jgi:outer membrane protein assembly factor BamB